MRPAARYPARKARGDPGLVALMKKGAELLQPTPLSARAEESACRCG